MHINKQKWKNHELIIYQLHIHDIDETSTNQQSQQIHTNVFS